MNLNEYPTPQSEKLWKWLEQMSWTRDHQPMTRIMASHEQLEREAAAWRAVAERYRLHDGKHELVECDEAFDAIKAELEKP